MGGSWETWRLPGGSAPVRRSLHGLTLDSRLQAALPWAQPGQPSLSPCRKVEDLQFRVEEESITKGDLEVRLGRSPAS